MTTTKDKVTLQDIQSASERLKNWGRWGADDEAGTLNNISPQDIVNAARLIRKGKVFSLALNFDSNGPQNGLWGNRFNPIHTMLATGTDAVAGRQESIGIRYADDMVSMPLQCGTQWDALGHVFNGEKMWNGYDARLVDSNGAQKNGIEKVKDKMVGRGVLLDVARYKGVDSLEDGYGIGTEELEKCAAAQGVEVRKGDFVIVRTGHMERCLKAGKWEGYAGGNAPGLRFETAEWIRQHGHRRDLRGHLGLRGPAKRNERREPALALGGDPHDRHQHGRDFLFERPGGGLRAGPRVRILFLRPAAADYEGGRISRESHRRQIEISALRLD